MKGFWTCGPFKKAVDNLEMMVFKAEQMKIFMDTLEESKKIDELIQKGSDDEKLLASLMKLDIDQKLETLIGIPDGNEKKITEISREAVFESLEGFSEK